METAAQTHLSIEDAERYRRAFHFMVLSRALDEKLAHLYRAGKIPGGGVYLGTGQEALSASIGVSLRRGTDIFAPLIRDGAGRLAFGETLVDALRTCLGSALGPMRGRDGNVHRGNIKEGYLPMISHLGAMISVVNGTLLARRFKGVLDSVGAACIGEGGTSTGAFHEGVNQAAVERLPLVIVIANNHYAYSTPTHRQFACASLADRAVGYGIRAWDIDGTSLRACLTAAHEAVRRARNGEGPQMIVARLLRLCGHGEHDDAHYVDPQLKQGAFGRDCIAVASRELTELGIEHDLAQMRRQAAAAVDEANALVQREPSPDPFSETWSALSTEYLREGLGS